MAKGTGRRGRPPSTETTTGKSDDEKRAAFRKLAEARVSIILEKLKALSHLSNTKAYKYDKKEINKIFGAIYDNTQAAKDAFENPDAKRQKEKLFDLGYVAPDEEGGEAAAE